MRNQPGAGVRRRAQCSEVSPDATKASPAADDDPCYLGASDFDTILAESVWGARKLGSPQKFRKGWSAFRGLRARGATRGACGMDRY
jgi:hypothetical protein